MSAWLVYLNTFQNDFHLDDFTRIVDNPGVQKLHPVGRHFVDPRTMSTVDRLTRYSPLLPLTLSRNYAVAGDSLPGLAGTRIRPNPVPGPHSGIVTI